MRIVLANNHLRDRGGSETYLITVARELERMGHDVVLFAGEPPGDGVPLARQEGMAFSTSVTELGGPPDRILAQDGIVSGLLAAAFPSVPQVFVAHGVHHAFQLPPALPETVTAVVALNDRVASRAGAMAAAVPVIRLRQPVELETFSSRRPARESPRRLLLFGNHQVLERTAALRRTCAERGVDVIAIGGSAGATAEPAGALRETDIVVGYGRCIVEAMATGRCAYVYDRFGADGWVDGSTYEALESTGFNGKAAAAPPGADDFVAALESYDAGRALEGRDLAYRYHDVRDHAAQLVKIFEQVAPKHADPRLSWELARLWREQWRWERQVIGAVDAIRRLQASVDGVEAELESACRRASEAEFELQILGRRVIDADSERERLRAELATTTKALNELLRREGELQADAALAERRLADAVVEATERAKELEVLRASRSFRLAGAAASVVVRLRRRRP